MKKVLFTLLAVSIIFAACKKEEDEVVAPVTPSIVVKTIDQHTHSLDIHFKHNYVNDGFEWKFKKVNGKHKKDGYTLSDGEDHILGELVGDRTKKKNVNTTT